MLSSIKLLLFSLEGLKKPAIFEVNLLNKDTSSFLGSGSMPFFLNSSSRSICHFLITNKYSATSEDLAKLLGLGIYLAIS